MTMSWSLTMQQCTSNELTMRFLPDICQRILHAPGESPSWPRMTAVLSCTTLMDSHRRQRFLWNLDTMPMESHTHYTFLMGMRRRAGSREWPRLFGNKDLRPNPNCKLNARDSIVHPVKPDAAVTDSVMILDPTFYFLPFSLIYSTLSVTYSPLVSLRTTRTTTRSPDKSPDGSPDHSAVRYHMPSLCSPQHFTASLFNPL